MKVGAAIYSLLVNDSAVSAIVGTRIYPELAEEGASAPYIVYSVVSNTPSDTKDGTPIDEAQLEVFSVGSTYAAANDLADNVRAALDRKSKIVVGVNDFINPDEPPVKVFRVDPSIGEKRVNQMKKFRKSRDMELVEVALNKLKTAAEGEENLMPHLIESFESYATIGEVCQVLREIWGEYEENVTL